MWPFCKNLIDCNTPAEDDNDDYVVYDYLLTYMDETTESIKANEFNWSEHDIVFRKNNIGIFWVRTCLVKKIERCDATDEVNVKQSKNYQGV